jgi:hypothetical protein
MDNHLGHIPGSNMYIFGWDDVNGKTDTMSQDKTSMNSSYMNT